MDEKKPAVFLDRDGVLTVEKKRILHPSQVELYEYSAEAVRRLKEAGYLVIVISNQSGIARGLFTEKDLQFLHEKLIKETKADAFYYCPHHPEGSVPEYSFVCECRKPKTGLIDRACKDFSVDLSASWMIGDRECDVLTGQAAGLKTILVRTGYGEEEIKKGIRAEIVAKDLLDAVSVVLKNN